MKTLTFNNYNLLALFSILTPFTIIVGTAIANFFLLLSIITFLLIDNKNYIFFYKLDNFSKILASFFIYILITSFFAENEFYSFKKAFLYLKFFFFFIALKICIEKQLNFFDIVYKFFFPIFLIVLLDQFIQLIFHYNLIGIQVSSSRFSGFFGDEWILGAFIFHLVPLVLLSVLFRKNKSNKIRNIYLLLIILISIYGIYISGERTIFFISIVYLFLITLLIFIENKFYFLFFIIFTLTFVAINPSKRIFKSFNFTNVKNPDQVYSELKVYKDLYTTAYKMFLDKKLFGHGVQSFRNKCIDKKFNENRYGCSTHPHNYYFQILGENGIIGLLIFLSIILFLTKDFLFIFIRWVKNKKDTKSLGLMIILLNIIVSFTPILPTGNMYSSISGIFIFFKLAIYFGLKARKFN